MKPDAPTMPTMATLADFARTLAVSKRSAERLLNAGKLPRPDLRLNKRVLRWRWTTIQKFCGVKGGAVEGGADK